MLKGDPDFRLFPQKEGQCKLCNERYLLPSPFASLCFSLYETRSYSVKPSWAITKLTLSVGLLQTTAYPQSLYGLGLLKMFSSNDAMSLTQHQAC